MGFHRLFDKWGNPYKINATPCLYEWCDIFGSGLINLRVVQTHGGCVCVFIWWWWRWWWCWLVALSANRLKLSLKWKQTRIDSDRFLQTHTTKQNKAKQIQCENLEIQYGQCTLDGSLSLTLSLVVRLSVCIILLEHMHSTLCTYTCIRPMYAWRSDT